MYEKRQRWRITQDQLAYLAGCSTDALKQWAAAGYLGPRAAEQRDQGFGRHITRELAQRAVLFGRCVKAGLSEDVAARIVADHNLGDTLPIVAKVTDEVTVKVSKENLP
jgi:hypothetical protein